MFSLRKIRKTDKKYFAKWWRDTNLLKLTSGILRCITDDEIDKYFQNILKNKHNYYYLITINNKVVGNISLVKKEKGWYETQIIIGDKKYQNKGYGQKIMKRFIKKFKKKGILQIYLEVRPSNIRAIKSYEKCGFKKIKFIKHIKNKYLPKTLRMEI